MTLIVRKNEKQATLRRICFSQNSFSTLSARCRHSWISALDVCSDEEAVTRGEIALQTVAISRRPLYALQPGSAGFLGAFLRRFSEGSSYEAIHSLDTFGRSENTLIPAFLNQGVAGTVQHNRNLPDLYKRR